MAERLGYVLYWTGLIFGLICLGFGLALAQMTQNQADVPFFAIGGIVTGAAFWLAGKACRYVLSGN